MSTGRSLHSSQTHTGFKTVSFSRPAYANEAAILPITRTGSLDERPQLAKGQAFTGSTVRNCGRNARKGPEGEDGEEAESVPSFVTHLITDDNRYSEEYREKERRRELPWGVPAKSSEAWMENQAARCLSGKVLFTWKQRSLISLAIEFKDECGTGALALAMVGGRGPGCC